MTISISSRIRNAMVTLSIGLCLLFTVLIFLLVYVIEDQVFINQLKAEKTKYQDSNEQNWHPQSSNMRLIKLSAELPAILPSSLKTEISQQAGVHEYFDDDAAMFIANFTNTKSNQQYFLVYDVKELLAVRGSKTELFTFIALLTLLICAAAILLAHRLTKKTLAPLSKLTHHLKNSDIDDPVIQLANEFSQDEIGVLAHELALALERAKDSAQREYDFNRGVSHELRSPIQVAQSATELITELTERQSEPANNSLRKPIARLKRSISEMNQIAEAFLWLAGNRQTKPTDRCSVSSLNELISECQTRETSIEWLVESSVEDDFSYPLPESVLMVILRSLIDNSIKHGDAQRISILLDPRKIHIENFATENQSTSFGVGLSITRRLCEHFNCSLLIDQQPPNTFNVSVTMPET